ncbi:MAG: response regulator [Candidatus Omnitrophica bacterium]|nr:response regulator [Candidatus Omnitrophota bacterium]
MKRINVVILDDEQYVLNCLGRLFRHEPYDVFYAKNYKQSLDIMEKEPVKVVISDQRMADIGGIEFLNIIQKKYPDVVRMIFTGYSNLKVIQDAIKKGQIDTVITKPWDDSKIKEIIRSAINKYDSKKHVS